MATQKTKITLSTEDLMPIPVAAKELGVHLATVYRWIKKGTVLPFRIGGQAYIPVEEVERLKRERGEA